MTVSRPVRRVAVFGVAALLVALLPTAQASAATPSVTITAPAAGPVSGIVAVSVDGTTDGVGTATSVTVFADAGAGAVPIGVVTCPGTGLAPSGCTGGVSWDTTALVNGPVSLTASLYDDATPGVALVTSAPVAVTVSNPVPTVAITPPSPPVSGATTVHVVGTSDGAGTATGVQFYVDAAPVGATASCPGTGTPPSGCVVDVAWDATTYPNGPHTLSARLLFGAASSVTSADVVVTVSNPAPTVAITSPISGATLAGLTSVVVSASTGATLSDYPASIAVFRDGSNPIGTVPCAASLHTCSGSVSWDATTLPGTHTLTAQVVTTRGVTVTSAPVAVTVSNPAPAVSITAPAPNSTLTGTTSVSVSASTATALSDYPASITVHDGLNLVGTVTCAALVHLCSGTLQWDTTSLTGPHALTAQVLTTRSVSAASASVPVIVSNPGPAVSVTSPTPGSTVAGATPVAVSASTLTSLSDYPASIIVRDGSTVIGTVTCAVSVHSCSGTVSWDTTGLAGVHNLGAVVVTTLAVSVPSVQVPVTVANPAPTVSITSPAPGSTLAGLTSVGVAASTDDALTDFPASIVVRDGSTVVGTVTCAASVHGCSGAVAWDTTTLAGEQTLTAEVVTTRAVSATSEPVTVTVTTPAPTAVITSPGRNAVVSGKVSIGAAGSTDPRRSDLPATFSLLVDGVARATAPCPARAHDCAVVLAWSVARSVGAQTIVVAMTTTSGATATSESRVVYASSASRVVLALPRIVRSGSPVLVVGRVVATTTGLGVAGVAVTVTRRPALGAASTVHVVTGAGGVFTVRYIARTNATVTAVVVRTAWLSTSVRVTSIRASAPMSCTVSSRTLAVGAVGRGRCAVAGLPAGTGLSLRYTFRGRLSTLASGRAKGPAIPFAFGFPARGVYLLRIDLVANRVYVATMSPVLRVVVR